MFQVVEGIDEDILTTWDEIQDTVQGSDAQIHKELHQIHAIKFDGKPLRNFVNILH